MKILEQPLYISKSAMQTMQTHNDKDIAANLKNREPSINGSVGIIPVNGILLNEDSFFAGFFGGVAYQSIRIALENFVNNKDVKSIILDMNSPGGDTVGCAELAEFIKAISKPIFTYVAGDCCSAAYYLGAATNQIISHKTGAVGSIGTLVFMEKTEGEMIIVSSQSPLKVPDPESKEGQAQIRVRLDKLTEIFINDVADFRQKENTFVAENFGRGDIVNVEKALEIGMIDIIGNFAKVLDIAKGVDKTVSNKNNDKNKPTLGGLKVADTIINKKKRSNLVLDLKQVLVIVDDETLTEDIATAEVTKEFIEENFPEIAEAFKAEGAEEAGEATEEVDEVAEIVDSEVPEEKEILLQARNGKITAAKALQKIFQLRKEVIKKDNVDGKDGGKGNNAMIDLFKKRGEDQLKIQSAGGGNEQTNKKSFGKTGAAKIKELRAK